MNKTLCSPVGLLAVSFILAIASSPAGYADRGGWADPPGGWTFVEDWNGDIPLMEGDPKWNHDNGSDQYSANANTLDLNDLLVEIAPGVPVGDVVRIETIEGEGDTEDGSTEAADASVLRLVDVGDPRDLGIPEPSDRKIFFLGALHEPGELTADPFETGITFITRFRIFPIFPDPDIGASLELVQLALDPDGDGEPDGDGSLRFIPEASDRAHVGIGYVDPDDPLARTLVGVGYYNLGSLEILVNDASEVAGEVDENGDLIGRDGDENIKILEGIDTAAFHTVWVNAIVDPEDPGAIIVRAFANGSTTPVIGRILRSVDGAEAPDRPNPETLGGAEWDGVKQLAFNIGSAGTPAAGGFQYDYMAATLAGAFDPQPAGGGSEVIDWELF